MAKQRNFSDSLFTPVDAASLAVFRIGFGLIMLVEMWRYFRMDWIRRYYITPQFHFSYYGFDWVQPWSETGMYLHFAALALLAFFVAIGFLYRFSSIAFTLGFTWIFLLDQTQYLNHFYLVILLGVLLSVLPAQRAFSVDAWRQRRSGPAVVPVWTVWALRAQFEVLYLYAGIVKLNADWLRLEPMGLWMARGADLPLIGPLMVEPLVVAVASYGVIVLHLVGAPLLLWRRTRLAVLLIYTAFHIVNHFAFNIGIFPWLTLFGTLIFFEPDWPRRVWRALTSSTAAKVPAVPDGVAVSAAAVPAYQRRLIIGLLCAWLALQVLVPLRHLLYPGNVSWTEEGHRFAWQMMLREKSGIARFTIVDPGSGRFWNANLPDYLTQRQIRKMVTRPDMLLQFAHHLRWIWARENNLPGVAVHVTTAVSLNGRAPVALVDPERDLAATPRNLQPADWILPLAEPLPATTLQRLLD
ncbi:MAG TPA: HTTM domain-containing protein [Gammaproteobacteria bacterium]|nr:HTTM domain-containing protein [Gammaproteobacteria bacterium]